MEEGRGREGEGKDEREKEKREREKAREKEREREEEKERNGEGDVRGCQSCRNESTKVQTLGAIPSHSVCQSRQGTKRVFEKVHALIKCRCNGGIRNIARQTITCHGTNTKNC